jgi:hypothetical protein
MEFSFFEDQTGHMLVIAGIMKTKIEVGIRSKVFAAGSIVTIMLLINPDHLIREGSPVMAEVVTADEVPRARRGDSVPPARAPSLAVAEEYELARQKGTAQAFELFIARHGDDPLAARARADLRRLSR